MQPRADRPGGDALRTAKKSSAPKAPSPAPSGAEELKEAKRVVEEYVRKVLALRRKLDADLVKVNSSSMTTRFEKQNRDDLARWARKEEAEKVLRTERVSGEEFRVETSGEGLGRLRYTLKGEPGSLKIDLVQRQCEFCFGKG